MTENAPKDNNKVFSLTLVELFWLFMNISFISHVENEILKIFQAEKGESNKPQLLRENEEL